MTTATVRWIGLAAMLGLPAAGCAAPERPAGAGAVLRYRMPSEPPDLDPFHATDDDSLVYIVPLFDGLVEFVPGTLTVRPALAESWEISADGLVYTFHLRPGARFHNGREITSADVVYSIRRALTKESDSQKRSFLEPIRGSAPFWDGESRDLPGVAAPDPRTVVITLDYSYEPFLSVLAGEAGSILPREVYDGPPESWLKRPVGSGPFRLSSLEPGISLTLTRFDGHWKTPPAGGFEGIRFSFIPKASIALEEYRSGRLDFTQEIPPGQREAVRREMPDHFRHVERLAILYLGLNLSAPPFKDNLLLRRAVSHAIDREFIVSALQEGKDRLAAGIIPPGMLGHDPARQAPSYDPAAAAELIARAGYPGGRGLPELTYRTNFTESFQRLAERIQIDLANVGIKVRIDTSDFGAFLQSMYAGKAQGPAGAFFRMTWFADWPDPDSFLAGQFATGATGNFTGFRDPEFDRLVAAARREPDRSRREAIYRQAEQRVLDQAVIVPIYWYGTDYLLRPEVLEAPGSPLGTFAIAWEEAVRRR